MTTRRSRRALRAGSRATQSELAAVHVAHPSVHRLRDVRATFAAAPDVDARADSSPMKQRGGRVCGLARRALLAQWLALIGASAVQQLGLFHVCARQRRPLASAARAAGQLLAVGAAAGLVVADVAHSFIAWVLGRST